MTAHDPEHDRLHDASGLYVLGALDPGDRQEFERHVASCAECAAEVQALAGVAGALPHAVTQVDPPAALRTRVLAAAGHPAAGRSNVTAFTPKPAPAARSLASAGWLSAAALLIVSVSTGGYAYSLRTQLGELRTELRATLARLDRSEQQVAVATRNVAVAEARMAVLTASDMTQVNLEGQTPVAPRASGRAFLSRSRGLLFTANDLPPVPAGRVYQLWVVTAQAPVSAGLIDLDASGRVAQAFPTPADLGAPVAVAVTLEPAGGVPAPTGDKYLVGLTH